MGMYSSITLMLILSVTRLSSGDNGKNALLKMANFYLFE